MALIVVELDPPHPADHEDEVVIIDDLDALTDAAIVMGCGDDNPYQ
ncbi:MAG: hypothetical protein ACRDTA_15500 [Pseudonocardiaceae bacterium]